MKTILIPVDGSEYSQRAIEQGKEFASLMDCKIILLSVVSDTFPVFPVDNANYAKSVFDYKYSLNKKEKEMLEEYLTTSKASFGELSSKVETVLLEGNPAAKIIEYLEETINPEEVCVIGEPCEVAEGHNIDLVIMGSKGIHSTGIQRFLVGSVTNKVLHHAKQPILVIK